MNAFLNMSITYVVLQNIGLGLKRVFLYRLTLEEFYMNGFRFDLQRFEVYLNLRKGKQKQRIYSKYFTHKNATQH